MEHSMMSLKKGEFEMATLNCRPRDSGGVESRFPNTAPDELKIVAMETPTC